MNSKIKVAELIKASIAREVEKIRNENKINWLNNFIIKIRRKKCINSVEKLPINKNTMLNWGVKSGDIILNEESEKMVFYVIGYSGISNKDARSGQARAVKVTAEI